MEVKPGGTDKLLSLLKYQFPEPDWKFVPVGGLKGDFDVKKYFPCTPTFPFPNGQCETPLKTGGAGAVFNLTYTPQEGDPSGNQIRWIQRFIDNYDVVERDELDIMPLQDNPFYFGTSGPNYFYDAPWVPNSDLNRKIYFYAETYLVEEVTTPGSQQRTVNIYDGVRWGWEHIPANTFKKYSGTLLSGSQKDRYTIENLLPGSKFYAYTNNDLPGNRCNPNTYLNTYGNYDDNSSPVGNGFASALTGTVSSNGTINLDVSTPEGGRRGEDRGNYELNFMVFGEENFSDEQFQQFTAGSSGGGGFGNELRGRTQDDPILSHATEGSWQVFRNVPGCRWYDPHTPYGFEFQALDDTLFTEILDFPVGPDNRFSVSVGDRILGEFGAGDSVDFTSLFGSGISNFKITGIDSLLGSTEETAFPIQLAFNDRIGSFKMRPFSQETSPQSVPESTSALGLLALNAWGIMKALSIRFDK